MTLLKKSQQGQFNTTNVDYILQEFTQKIIKKDVIDPFCGKRDLLNWAEKHGASSVFGIDIDLDLEEPDAYANSFIDPFDYTDAFILANPPYLAKNKSNDKSIFSLFKTDDLYKLKLLTGDEHFLLTFVKSVVYLDNKCKLNNIPVIHIHLDIPGPEKPLLEQVGIEMHYDLKLPGNTWHFDSGALDGTHHSSWCHTQWVERIRKLL